MSKFEMTLIGDSPFKNKCSNITPSPDLMISIKNLLERKRLLLYKSINIEFFVIQWLEPILRY